MLLGREKGGKEVGAVEMLEMFCRYSRYSGGREKSGVKVHGSESLQPPVNM